MMAPTPTTALAVPCFFLVFLSLVTTAPCEPVTGKTNGRRLRVRALALAEVSEAKAKAKDPLASGWFGDFSEAESTYSRDGLNSQHGDPEWDVKGGRDPSLDGPYKNAEVFKSSWFQEAESGGDKAAFQTNFPALKSSVAGNRDAKENSWRETPSGWMQEYRPMLTESSAGPSGADWFDNSVRQVDGFGRKLQPGEHNGARLTTWQERSVNTTLTCKKPGCSAKSALQLWDALSEEAKDCRLSFHIHPTDYDDDHGAEHVEFLKVNDYVVSRACNPRTRGCNSTAERPLYPCLNSFDVDKVVDAKGTLVLEGKNTQLVDECPHNGNLLSGVAMATCMVRNKPIEVPPKPEMFLQADLNGQGILKCDTPGCTAETLVLFSPAVALNGGKCLMNVSVRQTDYDDGLGEPEQIDFIQVEGANVTLAVPPKKNPCNLEYKGTPMKEDEMFVTAITSHDITELVKKSFPAGSLRVTGKISSQVDECSYQNNLLWANVTVHCTPPAKFSVQPPTGSQSLLHVQETEIQDPRGQVPKLGLLQRNGGKHLHA